MLPPLQPDEFRALREALTRAGYDEQGLLETLGPIEVPNRPGAELPHLLHLTRRGRPLDTLIRLFLLGVAVEEEAARGALAPASLEGCGGLLEPAGNAVEARVRLMPFRGLVLAVDQPGRTGAAERMDAVMGLTNSTISLANFTIRAPVRRALDLGTGCGIQAFLAARHSRQVTATDLSRRALEFAAFNAALNGCAGVRFLEGDGFEPVAGERFDLIVSNPPFAITPSCRLQYRDSGMPADEFARRLLRQASPLLEEGGHCQIVCDWVQPAGQDWQERLAGWFDGSGCDAWVLRTATTEAGEYAHMWIRDTEHPTPQDAARLYEEWLACYAREGIQALGTGLIVLRRRSESANWVRFDELPEGTGGEFGDAVLQGFRLRDFLAANQDDAALLGGTFRLSPDLRLQQQAEWSEGGWQIQSAQIRLQWGIRFAGNVDRNALTLLGRLDGRGPLRAVLAEVAACAGASPEMITPQCLALLRRLIERGYVLPAEWADETSGR